MTASIKFCVSNKCEATRVKHWRTKEPGTIKWIKSELKEDEVFWDVGANIGVYTLYAGLIVGPKGRVVAFEPHIPTAASLIRNITLNKMEDRVTLITSAIGTAGAWNAFNYLHLDSGTSGSQLGHCREEFDLGEFVPAMVECKHTCTADIPVPRPHLIKIDVDGNEADVLSAIGQAGARSIQIECHENTVEEVGEIMTQYGYCKESEHFTALGQRYINNGGDPSKVARNLVYRRTP